MTSDSNSLQEVAILLEDSKIVCNLHSFMNGEIY